jgi:hypothetical protein
MATMPDTRADMNDMSMFAHDATTQIVAVINRLESTIHLCDSRVPERAVTVWPGQTAGCQLRLDAPDEPLAEERRDAVGRHIEVQISRQRGPATRFWLWLADGQIKFSRRAPHDPAAATVPGNAVTGGDRVLTIDDSAFRRCGFWGTIWRRLSLLAGRSWHTRSSRHRMSVQ